MQSHQNPIVSEWDVESSKRKCLRDYLFQSVGKLLIAKEDNLATTPIPYEFIAKEGFYWLNRTAYKRIEGEV
jgi:hypothetical protein